MHSYDIVKFMFVGAPCLVDQALIQVSLPILGYFNSLHVLFVAYSCLSDNFYCIPPSLSISLSKAVYEKQQTPSSLPNTKYTSL